MPTLSMLAWEWQLRAWGLCAAFTRAAGTCGGASRGTPLQSVLGLRWPPPLLLPASWRLLPLVARLRLVAVRLETLRPAVLVRTRRLVAASTWYVKGYFCFSIIDLFKILGIEQREISFGFIELKFVDPLCF